MCIRDRVKGSGRDEILRTESCPSNHVKGKAKRLIGVHVEHVMKHFQPFIAGQRLSFHAEGFEVVEDVGLNAFELRLCRAEGVRLNAEGDVLLLDQSVVALGELTLQHTGILGADAVSYTHLFLFFSKNSLILLDAFSPSFLPVLFVAVPAV